MTESEPASAPFRADPRHVALGGVKPLYWQTPQGHWGGVEVRREFEVRLVYPSGGERTVNVGTNYDLALRLADSPESWAEPGPPGDIRYRDVVTITGAWARIGPLEGDPDPDPQRSETG